METYANGAKRSDSKPFYREIPLCALRREGDTLREGAIKYNETPWDSNWQKGDTAYALDCFDHAFEHLQKYYENIKARLSGKPEPWPEEDHLGHLRANTGFLAWFEENGQFACQNHITPPADVVAGRTYLVDTAIDNINAALDKTDVPELPPQLEPSLRDRILALFGGGQLP